MSELYRISIAPIVVRLKLCIETAQENLGKDLEEQSVRADLLAERQNLRKAISLLEKYNDKWEAVFLRIKGQVLLEEQEAYREFQPEGKPFMSWADQARGLVDTIEGAFSALSSLAYPMDHCDEFVEQELHENLVNPPEELPEEEDVFQNFDNSPDQEGPEEDSWVRRANEHINLLNEYNEHINLLNEYLVSPVNGGRGPGERTPSPIGPNWTPPGHLWPINGREPLSSWFCRVGGPEWYERGRRSTETLLIDMIRSGATLKIRTVEIYYEGLASFEELRAERASGLTILQHFQMQHYGYIIIRSKSSTYVIRRLALRRPLWNPSKEEQTVEEDSH
ncbi:hypothetical protein GPALN_007760 [Globodera pallida]|nr:hypothetical protein GPALN_007760 [Globodera pallida]